ncbi:hypothetical protein [Cystobacter ferrugineus]|uniref:Uncharacterized protein n=1 Tax=Cystobacter ferrugineus TaxID=83449 RepID=A0A1L9B8D0_9BACT|nr:hypothetical protein [Cystobacter ferrugineus]OJH38519.1 hypothetical protein BON30_19900 [Cystobacter ferrugineus]
MPTAMLTLAFAFVLAVGLFVLARSWIWRLEEGAGSSSFRAFVACGLVYAGLYGCALGWVMEQSLLLGVCAAFFSFPLVFGGVRQIAGYFGFDPTYYTASGGAFAALGLFFSLVVFFGPLTQVGLLVRTVEVRELPGTIGGAFHLLGATQRTDLAVERTFEREGTGLRNAKLAPIVPKGWTPGQPVPAWLLCRQYGSSYEENCRWEFLSEDVVDVVVPSSLGSANGAQLMEEAASASGLQNAPGAKLLSRSDDAEEAVLQVVLRGLLLPLFFVGLFVVLARIGRHHDEVAEKWAPPRHHDPE